MNYFRKRRIVKTAQDMLHRARCLRNIREDLLSESKLRELGEAERRLKDALGDGNIANVPSASEHLFNTINKLAPEQSFSAFAENLEVIIVAVAVAMAVKAYFIQPFKIPTGSMQETLYGISTQYRAKPLFTDRMPIKCFKWLVFGEWYKEVRVAKSGHLSRPKLGGIYDQANIYYKIANKTYKIPKNAVAAGGMIQCGDKKYMPGDYVPADTVLWSGIVVSGDHVFVDRMRWNFAEPKRGQIMVFSTDNIVGPDPPLPDTYYIKRLIGRPGEHVYIDNPHVYINGEKVTKPDSILRITEGKGYRPAGRIYDQIHLGDGEYFALGDNTDNSKDSRYWGAVPEENMVGPAFMVYWPFSKRWGWAR
ncbi:signal peptidase I [Verrucomicrobiota bacterium]